MDFAEPMISEQEVVKDNLGPRKPRLLLDASGSVAAIKFGHLLDSFSDWAEIKAVVIKSSLIKHQFRWMLLIVIYTDEEGWSSWKKIGDNVLHIELRKLVIAPLSASTLGKEYQ